MRVAYIQASTGVRGTALLGALLDAGASLETIQQGWQQLALPVAEIEPQRVTSAGHAATAVQWTPPDLTSYLALHHHTGFGRLLEASQLPERVRQPLLAMVRRFISAVEQRYPDGPPQALFTAWLTDLIYLGSGVVLALDELDVEACEISPLNLGSGHVEDQHTLQPIPHPVTAELVRGCPVVGSAVPGELTTIDGAAMVTALAARFGPLPSMTLWRTGYGSALEAGEPTPPHVQVMLGEVEGALDGDRIAVLEANIDDMNPEFYEAIYARLFAQGALDMTLTPMMMKKNRPANKLTVLTPLELANAISQSILLETSTFGVRMYEVQRRKLDRFWRDVETRCGVIPVKCGVLDGRIVQAAPEYDACRQLAEEHGIPVRLIYAEAAGRAAAWLGESQEGD
ncbi:MAG: hypothetical protein ETSY1_33805 [Candidatus Entotheonella factor]|uniref:Nickel insertion protein n=1 Tax=Entotheonella factor TaxID=1429438 RepID=W4L9B6_ENTF1|nr:LarC family nickel insertion protein [Candidatus Entotheonella palauensis]ETW94683.1 MAG: hypothetical protein ETSY1_33805 [Candidatus Entotheonella factor]